MRSWPHGPSHHVHRLKRLHRFLKNSGVKEARVFEPLAAIIWSYRPFRIGDRIGIQGAGTWGDVVDIGLRTTRIRARDNRLVIVPNSVIGANQVINYSYPDPQYRIETHLGIAYGTDIEAARQIIVDTVRQVEGVLPDRPVDALYVEMGDSAMVFPVC